MSTYKLEARPEGKELPRPSVAVDVVILTVTDGALFVCLYERSDHPAKETYALPGGFMRIDESLDDAARRIVREKAGLDDVFLEQLYTFGDPGRDPRGRVITVAHVALIEAARFHTSKAPKGRIDVPWPGETGGPVDVTVNDDEAAADLAFDHGDILGLAVKRLRGKLDYTPIGFQLLPAEFTLRALQDVHEAVRGEQVNKDSFRRRMLASGHIEATGSHERGVTWRPAELYRFVRRSAV
ncbi:MAG: NUDIX domain-containing protein [Deltaproteobacteria bacterium]|nr:NUDIX domain-containing protein [Deltaproteobacteria bacterium]